MSKGIAATLGFDLPEMKDYRYQDTRTTRAIYSIGDSYFAVGKTAPKDKVGKPWFKAKDQFWAEHSNTVLWESAIDADA